MSKKCTSCGSQIGDNCKYCTECGTMQSDRSQFTYYNKSIKNPTYYMGSGSTTINKKYGMLIKNMNMIFAIGIGVVVAFVGLVAWITFK